MTIIEAHANLAALTLLWSDDEVQSIYWKELPELAVATTAEREQLLLSPDGTFLHWPIPRFVVYTSEYLRTFL